MLAVTGVFIGFLITIIIVAVTVVIFVYTR